MVAKITEVNSTLVSDFGGEFDGWVFFRLDSFAEIRRFFSVLFIPQDFNGILYRGLIEFSRIDMVLVVGISNFD